MGEAVLVHSCSIHAGTCEDTDLCVHTYVHVRISCMELGVGLLLCGRPCGSTS